MDIVLLLCRLILSFVFAVAGVTKLCDRAGSQKAIIDFGVPAIFASLVSLLLPILELVIAGLLIPRGTAWVGAVGALALLLIFTVGISVNLAKGRTPNCNCFGQLHSAPISQTTLVRNTLLAALTVIVVVLGREDYGLSVITWRDNLSIFQVIGLLGGVVIITVMAIQGWLVLNLLRQNGRLLIRLEALETEFRGKSNMAAPSQSVRVAGLPMGAQAPGFRLKNLEGGYLQLDELLGLGRPLMLIFSDPNCGPCQAILPNVSNWVRDYGTQLSIVVISRGSQSANYSESLQDNLLLQEDYEVSRAYQAYVTPSAVIVRADGTIGSHVAEGSQQITLLIETISSKEVEKIPG